MSALPREHKSWSPFDAIVQWCRGFAGSGPESELKCFADADVERIAKDVGVSVSELRTLAMYGPEAADLLLRRMAALDLDRNEVARLEPQTFQDLQRVCIMCDHHKRCARDFARDPASEAWKEYCPNAATLIALNVLPWAARHD